MKYIAKPDTWFDEGIEVILIDDYRLDKQCPCNMGLFKGWRTCENPLSEGKSKKINEKYLDEEVCSFDEFDEE